MDWFDPVFDRIIRAELEESPTFHRKQWEFAQIFRALQALGCLNPRSRGLSMGGGKERLLYAVARHVRHLTVTDLYESDSAWEEARTDDPDSCLKDAAPFEVDLSRLTAGRMDMRALEFPDESFEFCYSSCAIEHIGKHDDFVRHLQEVRRVLKADGVYVLTTEFHFGDEVIPAPHNYYFSSGFLDELMRAASFATMDGVDGAVQPHAFNRPLPANLRDLCAEPTCGITAMLLKSIPHLHLLTGGLPFTSLCLVLKKPGPGVSTGVPPMDGLQESREFIEAGVRSWKAFVENTTLNLDPFGLLGDRRPPRGIPRLVVRDADNTPFHTGYVWLGNALRSATVDVEIWPASSAHAVLELCIHAQPTRRPDEVICTGRIPVSIRDRTRVRVRLPITTEDGCSYAVLGKMSEGACWVSDPTVQIGAPAS